ncbi:retrovirus-related pol polyprotein from transposon TNT 1-94, partial [Tanacetum coccineum]
ATKSGQVPVNAAKQSSPRAAASISTASPINNAAPKPKVNDALPPTYSYFQAHSLVNSITTAGTKAVVSTAEGNGENAGNSQYTLQDQGIFDSGCSRHMTGNKSFLTDYQEIDGGFVAFGGSPKGGKITEKGKIRSGKLDFEDVYFVKELKCDNRTEFKNNDMNQFYGMKGIKREFSVARTPQQNRVAERKNRTLIENRVLVTKPRNKTHYKLLHGRPLSISFMRPFGCPMTILNTLDPLGNFDRKVDEGFLVGYSINSKAFRVFNTRTRKVKENLHITFLENKPNVAGSGPDWLFDIDLLTNSMNYEPSSEDAVADDAGKKTTEEPANEGERNDQKNEGGASNKDGDQNVQDLRAELDKLCVQQKEAYTNSTNRVSTISQSVGAVRQSFINVNDLPTDPLMPDLEDTTDFLNTCIFSGAYDDEDVGAEADLNN